MLVKIKEKEFKEFLAKSNVSQAKLAESMDMSATYLNNIIAGRHTASPEFRESLMKALDIEDWDSIFEIVDKDVVSQPMALR
jgi:transcriptional regulator with XRE-family HTH domain